MRTYPIHLNLAQIHILYEIAKLEIHELKEQQRRTMMGEADCWGPEQMDRLRQWTDLERKLMDRWYEALGEEMAPDPGSLKGGEKEWTSSGITERTSGRSPILTGRRGLRTKKRPNGGHRLDLWD